MGKGGVLSLLAQKRGSATFPTNQHPSLLLPLTQLETKPGFPPVFATGKINYTSQLTAHNQLSRYSRS